MQPLTMVSHPVMVMQPVFMVLELSSAVCVYGDVAVAFLLCLDFSSSMLELSGSVCIYGDAAFVYLDADCDGDATCVYGHTACDGLAAFVYSVTVIWCSLCLLS